jgi:hypothetical protein
VKKCRKSVGKGFFIGNIILDDLRDAWYQVNCCRLYTQESVDFENYTQTAMGNINDAREMMDSLIHWGKGLTPHGGMSIMIACSEAQENINVVHTELENILSGQVNESELSKAAVASIWL